MPFVSLVCFAPDKRKLFVSADLIEFVNVTRIKTMLTAHNQVTIHATNSLPSSGRTKRRCYYVVVGVDFRDFRTMISMT